MSDYWQDQHHTDTAFQACDDAGHEIPVGCAGCACGMRGTGPIVGGEMR